MADTDYIDDVPGVSPINKAEELKSLEKIKSTVINAPFIPTPNSAINPASPINADAGQLSPPNETTGSAQSNITSKVGELKTEVPQVKQEEPKSININLENIKSDDTKKGEIFNSSSNTSTTNNTTNVSSDTSNNYQNTNTSQVSTTTNRPVINSDNKKSVFGTVVKNLTKNAVDSLNITNSPDFAKNLGNYLEVGKEKLLGMVSPITNTYNTVKSEVDKAKNETVSITNTKSAVNNPVSNKSTTQVGDNTSTQTTNSQVTVDAKSPVIPKDTTLAAPKPAENKTSLIETSSNKEVKNNNEVTYKESTQIGGSNKPEKVETQNQQIIQQGAPVNINMGELVNEMRAIKLLLMSGIDVTHK